MKPGINSNFEINRPLWKKTIKSFFNLFGLEILRTNNFLQRRENLVVEFDNDNYLYFSVGDRGNRDVYPQDITLDGGKIYRINDDGTIPDDNPLASGCTSLSMSIQP